MRELLGGTLVATVICVDCGRPEERSFYRGYRLAEDRSFCHKAKLRRFRRGVHRYWQGNECGKHWPPVAGVSKGFRQEVTGSVWRYHDYECPQCSERFCDTEWQDIQGNWHDQWHKN